MKREWKYINFSRFYFYWAPLLLLVLLVPEESALQWGMRWLGGWLLYPVVWILTPAQIWEPLVPFFPPEES